jgi:predicted nucleotidyltransferase
MSLGSFLFSEYRRKVLALMLLHPDRQYHQREIARLTGTISGTLSRELSKMVDVGLLLKVPVGNQMQYRANPQSPIFPELAGILRKTDGMVEAVAEALAPLADQITAAFIFGSVASGKETSGSDIDLMVIGDISFSALITQLYPLQESLGREINPKQFPDHEWFEMLLTQGGFVRDVMGKPKLFVIGSERDLTLHKE